MKSRFTKSLLFHLAIRYAVSSLLFLFSAFCIAYFLVQTSMYNEIDEDLAEDIGEFRKLYNSGGIDSVISEIERDIKTVDTDEEFIRLFNNNGVEIFSSGLSRWAGLAEHDEYLKSIIANLDESDIMLDTLELAGREYDTRIACSSIGTGAILLIGESLEQVEDVLELILVIFSIILLALVPLIFITGWLVTKQPIHGILQVSQAAEKIRNGQLDTRITATHQSEEIRNLVSVFNSMTGQIQKLIKEMREMIENIAHDLRSPLARIRVISEMALSTNGNIETYKKSAAEIIDESDRLIQLINISLDVAEAEACIEEKQKELLNISNLVKDAFELFEPVAEEKNIEMNIDFDPDCRINGNRQNIQRMVANLIDNALKYTRENGKVNISVSRNGGQCCISVSDTGIGIPDADQPRIFDRFYRCDQSRSHNGSGLGLSFARAVARSHDGDITFESIPGTGSTFRILLPLAAE